MADLKNAPKESTLVGEVVSVSGPIASKKKAGSFFRVITLEDWVTGATYQRPISENFFQGVNGGSGLKSVLQEGKFVKLTINHLIEGKTEYVDEKTGDVQFHTSTSDVIQGAVATSSARYVLNYKASLAQGQPKAQTSDVSAEA